MVKSSLPSITQKIKIYRLLCWALGIIGVILVAFIGEAILQQIPAIESNPQYALIFVIDELPYIIVCVVCFAAGGIFNETATRERYYLRQRIAGYVKSNELTNIEVLADWFGIDQIEASNIIAELAAQDKIEGYTIDLQRQLVYRNDASFQFGPPEPAEVTEGSGEIPVVRSAVPQPSNDVIKLKASLYELDQLKQQGKISDQAYERLKDEYERKLSQSETGTKVY